MVKGLKNIAKGLFGEKNKKIVNKGYSHHGASRTKKSLRDWNSSGGSAKEDIEENLEILRERTRDLYMGASLATGAIKTIRTNVVGSGLKLNPRIDYDFLKMTEEEAERWERNTEREFKLWAESIHCDAQRMNNFYELQSLAFLSQLMSGECFVLLPKNKRVFMPYDLRIMLIEADRICTPTGKEFDKNIFKGVEIGKFGEVIAYYVAQKHPGSGGIINNEWKRVLKFGQRSGRSNILHLMENERPEQRRGIPVLAPVIENLKQISRYTEAELVAAVVSGMFTTFITKKDDDDDGPLGSYSEMEDEYEEDEIIALGNGAVVTLREGEDVKEVNPGRPNTAFDGFVKAICRQVGAALELPYELLIKEFTSSYSASRGALLEAWKMFRMRRAWLANDFCQPIYEEWLAEAVAKGRVFAPGFFDDPLIQKAYTKCEWNGPSQGQLDPLKEVKAATHRVEQGFSTRQRETVELTGGDFQNNLRQLNKEKKAMKDGGLIDEVLENKERSK